MITQGEEISIGSYIEEAQRVLSLEARALLEVSSRLGDSFNQAVECILGHKGKVMVCGIGKSGQVAQKMASTLSSTGTPAVYLHPGEAVHGDLGMYHAGDPTILISKSGATGELMRLIPILRQLESPIIAIVSNTNSPMAEQADIVLDGTVESEADPLGIVPTTSAVVAMAIGDALASCLMRARSFGEEDFARFHPGGQLGRNLLYSVGDVMHRADKVACFEKGASFFDVISAMTERPLGGAVVLGKNGELEGIVTDGDIRRFLVKNRDLSNVKVEDFMTRGPIVVTPDMKLGKALEIMENRKSQISVLPVVEDGIFMGLLRLHDIYRPE